MSKQNSSNRRAEPVKIGLGTPRESLRLAGAPEARRLVTTKTTVDYTEAMLKFAHAKIEQLQRLNLNGYIAYNKDQVYLNPHPKELMLRNHV
jgi:uncharacterized protein YbbK (DUF523 family)